MNIMFKGSPFSSPKLHGKVRTEYLKYKLRPGTVTYACNPSTLRGRGRCIIWGQELETSLANMVKPHLYWKYKNWSGVVALACNLSYSGGWGRRITWTWEVEVAVSRDRVTALHPGRWSETPPFQNTQKSQKEDPWKKAMPDSTVYPQERGEGSKMTGLFLNFRRVLYTHVCDLSKPSASACW